MTNPSPLHNFVSIQSATERCLRLLGKNSTEADTKEHSQELLMLSAGTQGYNPGVYYYRPYLVAAILLSQDFQANALTKAGDVEFKDKLGIIQAFLNTQQAIDSSQSWSVPTGFTVAEILGTVGLSASSKPIRGLFKSYTPVKVVF